MLMLRIFTEDMGKDFRLRKCRIAKIKNATLLQSMHIELSDEKKTQSPEDIFAHAYLGIIQQDKIKNAKMRENLTK